MDNLLKTIKDLETKLTIQLENMAKDHSKITYLSLLDEIRATASALDSIIKLSDTYEIYKRKG